MSVLRRLAPIQSHHDVGSLSQYVLHPVRSQLGGVQARIAQQAVNTDKAKISISSGHPETRAWIAHVRPCILPFQENLFYQRSSKIMNLQSLSKLCLAIILIALCTIGCSEDPAAGPGANIDPNPDQGSARIDDGSILSGGITHNGMTLNGMTLNGIILNGMTLNGMTLNGVSLNGVTLNGMTLNGITLNGVTLNGMTLNGVTLNGSLFSYTPGTGPSISGLAFAGAIWQLTVQPSGAAQPAQVALRFDNIYADPRNTSGDVFLYDISYSVDGNNTWTSLCRDGAGNRVAAIPIRNRWNYQTGARIEDPSAITFACANAALGKCVRLGYRPWATAQSGKKNDPPISLADHHQACTRLIRADYCGNGTSYTLDGTLIEVYDDLQPNINSNTMNWSLEGQWNPDGARCIGDARHAELLTRGRLPDCSGTGRPTNFPNCGNRQSLTQALLASTFQ